MIHTRVTWPTQGTGRKLWGSPDTGLQSPSHSPSGKLNYILLTEKQSSKSQLFKFSDNKGQSLKIPAISSFLMLRLPWRLMPSWWVHVPPELTLLFIVCPSSLNTDKYFKYPAFFVHVLLSCVSGDVVVVSWPLLVCQCEFMWSLSLVSLSFFCVRWAVSGRDLCEMR